MEVQPDESNIRTESRPTCLICGAQGNSLYLDLQERIFNISGTWNLKKCSKDECGLIWLDPMPTEEDVGMAYQTYYTHEECAAKRHPAVRFCKMGFNAIYGLLLHISRLNKQKQQMVNMYLTDVLPGRLLEVGCGAGHFLNHMGRQGWAVEGVDFDLKAAEYAQAKYGVKVLASRLEDVNYPNNSFDAVTMNHVIEHIHDPIALLKECYRILKPGGHLVVVTPNINSWGHRKFGENWRDLDPPRHLYLFSQKNLKECAARAGFQEIKTLSTPVNAWGTHTGSLYIEATGKYKLEMARRPKITLVLKALAFQCLEFFQMRQNSDLGEEVVLLCKKR